METVLTSRPARRPGRRLVAVGVVVVVLVALAMAGWPLETEAVSPAGYRFSACNSEGRPAGEATELPREQLARRTSQAVRVTVGATTAEVLPRAVGLQVDVEATVGKALDVVNTEKGAFQISPRTIAATLTGPRVRDLTGSSGEATLAGLGDSRRQ